jgi:hypothetical protein
MGLHKWSTYKEENKKAGYSIEYKYCRRCGVVKDLLFKIPDMELYIGETNLENARNLFEGILRKEGLI